MKFVVFAFFAAFFGLSALVLPYKVSACETYEQPCGGDEDRTGDDIRDTDPIVNPGDNDRHDNDDNEPSF